MVFGDDVGSAEAECLEGCDGAFCGERAYHDDVCGGLSHDAAEGGEAVHFGHLDIEGDDVGLKIFCVFDGFFAVARDFDDEHVGLIFEHAGDRTTHKSGVIYN